MRAFLSHFFWDAWFSFVPSGFKSYQEKFNWQKILFLRNIWFLKLGSFETDIYKFETLKLWDFDLKFET